MKSRGQSAAVAGAALALVLGSSACASWNAAGALASIVDRRELHSVPEFLASLPEGLRSHYALMFETRSPQPASYEAPRVILYGEDAKHVVAFGGASDSIDLMDFDDDTRAFVFREVAFRGAGPAGLPSMVVSEANPARCRACHGSPPRPVWDTYPLWPGAYGESALAYPSADERDGYARFARIRAEHPRYRTLVDHRETGLEATERQYRGRGEHTGAAELAELLGELNAEAIAAELRASPAFDRYRYALLAALTPQCGDVVGALPYTVRSSFPEPYLSFSGESSRANAQQAAHKRLRAHSGASRSPPVVDSVGMTRLRYLSENGLGISTASWTLALEKGSYDFTSSARAGRFERRLFMELAGSDYRVVELREHGADTQALCMYVDQHSRSALGLGQVETASAGDPAPPALLERCAGCHEAGVGPRIPFGEPEELARRLAMPAGSHGSLLEEIRFRMQPEAGARRMPLVFNPPEEERARLLSYLGRLVTESRAK